MNLYIKINSDRVGYSNLREILETPYVFNLEVFDCVDVSYGEIGECTYENINLLNRITEFEVTEENFYSVIDFVKECEYLSIKEILKDKVLTEYMGMNADVLAEKYNIAKEDMYFTDGDIYVDREIINAYKLKKGKMVYIGKAKNILMSYELEWFDTVYLKNISEKKLLKTFLNTEKRKYTKKDFINYVQIAMERELVDIGEANENVMCKIDDNIYDSYLSVFCTSENYKEFLRKEKYHGR